MNRFEVKLADALTIEQVGRFSTAGLLVRRLLKKRIGDITFEEIEEISKLGIVGMTSPAATFKEIYNSAYAKE